MPGLAPADSIPAQIPPIHAFERERPIAATRPEASSTSFWLHLGLVGLTMILAFVGWCIYVLHGRTTPWSHAETTASRSVEPKAPVVQPPMAEPAATSTPAAPATPAIPEPTRTAAAQPRSSATVDPTAPDAVTQALAIARRQAASVGQAAAPAPATPKQTATVPRAAPTTRTASLAPRTRRDAREAEDPLDYPVVIRRPSTQQDAGPPIAPGPGPQYSWTRPASSRVADDPGPPIAIGPGPRYEARSEVRAPIPAVSPAGDSGPPIAIGPGPRYDYSTPAARER